MSKFFIIAALLTITHQKAFSQTTITNYTGCNYTVVISCWDPGAGTCPNPMSTCCITTETAYVVSAGATVMASECGFGLYASYTAAETGGTCASTSIDVVDPGTFNINCVTPYGFTASAPIPSCSCPPATIVVSAQGVVDIQ